MGSTLDIEKIIEGKLLSVKFDDHDSNDAEYIRHLYILQVIYMSTY